MPLSWTKGPACARRGRCIASWRSTTKSGSGATNEDIQHTETCFYLYVILDIFSRYVVGWMVAPRETAALAIQLIEDNCMKQNIGMGTLTIHADRGGPVRARSTALLMADLGVTRSHSRPHVFDDNPFSESQFKTLKYNPEFPARFGSITDARAFLGPFFHWYNTEHRHSGIAMMTPEMVHYGLANHVQEKRELVLHAVYAVHPERFVRGIPSPLPLPDAVWINPRAEIPTDLQDAVCLEDLA